MEIEAVKVRRLYLEVAGQLSRLIKDKHIKGGTRLPSERELAAKFGVSRPTIREAMIALEIAGLVEVRTGLGIYVRENPVPLLAQEENSPDYFEVLEVRRMFMSQVAGLAAVRISEEQLVKLERVAALMQGKNQSPKVVEKAHQEFHGIVAAACRNTAISTLVTWLEQLYTRSRTGDLCQQQVELSVKDFSTKGCRALLNALKRRDSDAACVAMYDHLSVPLREPCDDLQETAMA